MNVQARAEEEGLSPYALSEEESDKKHTKTKSLCCCIVVSMTTNNLQHQRHQLCKVALLNGLSLNIARGMVEAEE